MTASCTLRAARPHDALSIARHRYFRGEPQDDIDNYAAWLAPRIERGSYVGFVGEAAGQVVAGAGAVLLDWGPTRGEATGLRARVANVFTEPAWRRQGLSRALVGQVMAQCDARGIRVFNLAASDEAEPMYRSFGFEPYLGEMILRR
ncbi:GNAT family N-acetyltransferase [Ideonella sp. BN130291]|uniref:GNAT family N-acetyltransferase n=1 Tax=Ideonella sp. BN130291 TaxID=3112940 RepID=UPI002E256F7D|nr:GNAT family N-acetyltransferase [Ideonella sp. BN130291]